LILFSKLFFNCLDKISSHFLLTGQLGHIRTFTFFTKMADEALKRVHRLKPIALSRIAHAVAASGHGAPELLAMIADAPRGLSVAVWPL
jgi:hypothetical protein